MSTQDWSLGVFILFTYTVAADGISTYLALLNPHTVEVNPLTNLLLSNFGVVGGLVVSFIIAISGAMIIVRLFGQHLWCPIFLAVCCGIRIFAIVNNFSIHFGG